MNGRIIQQPASLTLGHAALRWYDHIEKVPVIRGLFASRRICRLLCDNEPQCGAPIFIIVHGTWPGRAKWTQSNSTLVAELSKRWPGAGIYRFKWSGTNGVRQRLVAADVLCDRINDLGSRFPESELVTISHSHGGNIVAWASTRIRFPIRAASPDATRDSGRKYIARYYDMLPGIMMTYSFHLERFYQFRRTQLKRLTPVHFNTLELLRYVEERTGGPRYEDLSNLLSAGFLVAGGAENDIPKIFSADALAKLKQRWRNRPSRNG